jgi:hypothetical protein
MRICRQIFIFQIIVKINEIGGYKNIIDHISNSKGWYSSARKQQHHRVPAPANLQMLMSQPRKGTDQV